MDKFVDEKWAQVLVNLERYSRLAGAERDIEAMRRIAVRMRDTPELRTVEPTSSHAALMLSSINHDLRICVGWNGEQYKVSTVQPGFEFVDTVLAERESEALELIRARATTLWSGP